MLYLKSVSSTQSDYFQPDGWFTFRQGRLWYSHYLSHDYMWVGGNLRGVVCEVLDADSGQTYNWDYPTTLAHLLVGDFYCTFDSCSVFISSPFIVTLYNSFIIESLDEFSFILDCLYHYGDGANVMFNDNEERIVFFVGSRSRMTRLRVSYDEVKRLLVKATLWG